MELKDEKNMAIVSTYAPPEEKTNEDTVMFYETLEEIYNKLNKFFIRIVMRMPK